MKRETEDLKNPRIYETSSQHPIRVTCVHATIFMKDGKQFGFGGCFSETHHINVSKQAILNICHNFYITLKHLEAKKLPIPDDDISFMLKYLDQIRDECEEIDDAVKVLKVQTEDKW